MASRERFPALPDRIKFTDAGFLDAEGKPMLVTQLPGAAGPFFLEDEAHQKVMSWVQGHPSDAAADFKLLVLTGPTKSGKTAVLKKVLPCMLAEQHAVEGGATPVFLHFSFTVGEGPEAAADKLCRAAARFAESLGFRLPFMPTTPAQALTDMSAVIWELATGIAAAGGELVLLIDEAQVRLHSGNSTRCDCDVTAHVRFFACTLY